MPRLGPVVMHLSPRLGWGPIAPQQQLGSINWGTITYTWVGSSLISPSIVVKNDSFKTTHTQDGKLAEKCCRPALRSAVPETAPGDFRWARISLDHKTPSPSLCPGAP